MITRQVTYAFYYGPNGEATTLHAAGLTSTDVREHEARITAERGEQLRRSASPHGITLTDGRQVWHWRREESHRT